jgi:hypothetical protein
LLRPAAVFQGPAGRDVEVEGVDGEDVAVSDGQAGAGQRRSSGHVTSVPRVPVRQ